MVTYTVNYAAGNFTLGDAPSVTQTITQVPASGQTDYFFTSTNIYNATMFALQQPGGDWFGTLFYGRTIIGADGQVGFLPDAQIEGSVRGLSVDAFATNYVVEHGSSDGLLRKLFSGDDTLIDNVFGGALRGEAGDDVIIGGYSLNGGSGDDVLQTIGDDKDHAGVVGGTGNDFIFMGGASISASGDKGDDTFFFDDLAPAGYRDFVRDLQGNDRLQLDPAVFVSLADGFSSENFVVGSKALDQNDFLIFRAAKRVPTVLYYDPDGSGAQPQMEIAYFSGKAVVTWENILVSDETPATGDPAAPPSFAQHQIHPWAIHATGLLP